MAEKILEMKNIVKTFPGVKALDHAYIDLYAGEVNAFLGENGAGKSTLMKVLTGVYQKDEGEIIYNGKSVNFKNPKEAQENGISIIYQEFNLLPHLSVADNIFITREFQGMKGIVNESKQNEEAQKILNQLGLKISPEEKVMNLSVAEQQMVEIAKALSTHAKILIMDEPTAALTDREIEKLFEVIENLKKDGVGIIYISHRMEELKIIADRATVMRDGKYIDTVNYKDTTNDDLIKLMVGRDITEQYPARNVEIGEALLEVEDLSYKKHVKAINFSVKKGEILGVAGLMGSGRTEMAKVIFGAYEKSGGKVFMEGKEVHIKNPKEAIKLGIAYLTEDRKKDGLFLNLSIEDNIMIANLNLVSDKSVLNKVKSENITKKYIEKMKIKTPSKEQFTKNLSGGNQQKVILARWLCQNKKIVIFDEPTRGIDVGAKREVYNLMNELVETGAGIIMISSELPEILGMSDRVMIMHEGKIGNIIDIKDATEERILYFATGGINKYEKE